MEKFFPSTNKSILVVLTLLRIAAIVDGGFYPYYI